jgi:two-component system alkaline phosphatase synthesis response regulator PhoP
MATPTVLLIVEDEATASKALRMKFEKANFQITIAGDGEQALSALKEKKFDVVLLDLVLPKKDGFEVLTELQQQKNTTPVIVLTNLGTDNDAERAKSLGAKGYFVKSMTPMKDVVDFIHTLLPA